MARHNDLGNKGEALAVEHLLKKDYRIVERNYRYLKAEIDIIAQTGQTLCAVEVKTRSTTDFGHPLDFIKRGQIQRLVLALDHYISTHNLEVEARFDVIGIIKNKSGTSIEHLEDAFYFL